MSAGIINNSLGCKVFYFFYITVNKSLENGFRINFLILDKLKIMKLPLKNIVWKEGDFYVAQCLNVEVSSFGDSKDEALKNLQEALDLFFEDMLLG